ncbi:MAG: selenium cofactor biosynthesis protein YqeC [bacterium]
MSGESLSRILGLGPGLVLAAVGGGGKTSLLSHLARECWEAGMRPVVLTTTTHFFAPEGTGPRLGAPLLLGEAGRLKEDIEALAGNSPITLARARAGEAPVPGAAVPGSGFPGAAAAGAAGEAAGAAGGSEPARIRMKLRGFGAGDIEIFRDPRGAVLVEADGSRGRPIKAPGPGEPVIPPGADIVIGIIGLDSLGAPIDEEHAFRPEILAERVGLSAGSPIDATAAGRLAAHPEGLFRGAPEGARKIVVLNKFDLIARMEKPEQIGYIISEAACTPNGPAEAVILTTCLPSGLRVVSRFP